RDRSDRTGRRRASTRASGEAALHLAALGRLRAEPLHRRRRARAGDRTPLAANLHNGARGDAMIPENFHLLRPAWLLALLPIAALLWSSLHRSPRTSARRRLVDEHLL